MSGSAQRSGPNQRLFDGRLEKRLPTSVPVYIAPLEDPRAPERTVTENVSPHGARVISRRCWRPGDEPLITPLTGEFPRVGRVIYCLPKHRIAFAWAWSSRIARLNGASIPAPNRITRAGYSGDRL